MGTVFSVDFWDMPEEQVAQVCGWLLGRPVSGYELESYRACERDYRAAGNGDDAMVAWRVWDRHPLAEVLAFETKRFSAPAYGQHDPVIGECSDEEYVARFVGQFFPHHEEGTCPVPLSICWG